MAYFVKFCLFLALSYLLYDGRAAAVRWPYGGRVVAVRQPQYVGCILPAVDVDAEI